MTAQLRGPLVTIGEVLAVLRADNPGPLCRGQALRLSVAGAESNVAIGVRRLGHPATFIGRIGADSLGSVARTALLGSGVTARLPVDPTRRTGLMIVEQRMRDVRRVHYYRHDSAGSAIAPQDIDLSLIDQAGLLHITGITPALSVTAREAVETALARARAQGVPVSFDLNYRAALISVAQYRQLAAALMRQADIVFASLDEARLVLPEGDALSPDGLATALQQCGAGEIVLTDGRNGAWARLGQHSYRQPALSVTAVDPIGAGDAFVAGYLASRFNAGRVEERLSNAAKVAAVCVATEGDWEGLPDANELDLLDLDDGVVAR